jgi:hypothetical protein
MLELPKRLRIQVEKRYLLWLHLPKTKAIGAKDAGVPSAFAQSADWNLTINFINVPYGTDRINVHVNGPFSSSPIASDVIATGPSPSTTLTSAVVMFLADTPIKYVHQRQL